MTNGRHSERSEESPSSRALAEEGIPHYVRNDDALLEGMNRLLRNRNFSGDLRGVLHLFLPA